jgi:hypothetical protein
MRDEREREEDEGEYGNEERERKGERAKGREWMKVEKRKGRRPQACINDFWIQVPVTVTDSFRSSSSPLSRLT